MERTITTKDLILILQAVNDEIEKLNEDIGRYFQYSEESENVDYKRKIRMLTDHLDEDRTNFISLRSRLMSSGR